MKNCKVGDLAVVIKSDFPENVGILVNVLAAHPFYVAEWYVEVLGRAVAGHAGEMSRAGAGGRKVRCADSALRPIRDQPGDDETLTWAGLPRYIADPDQLRRLRESLGIPA